MKCNTVLGYYNGRAETCYKQAGHEGKCFSSPGLEMEDIFRRILSISGYFVEESTDKEDRADKVDLWLFYEEKCQYLPIQFTISIEDFPWKAKDALKRKVIPIYVSEETLMKWERSNDSLKEQIQEKIHNEVTRVVKEFVKIYNFNFTQPRHMLPIPVMN